MILTELVSALTSFRTILQAFAHWHAVVLPARL